MGACGAVLLMASTLALALSLAPLSVRAPQDCPDGLRIESVKKKGMITYTVTLNPDRLENATLYAGRVSAVSHLDLRVGDERLAEIRVQGREGRKGTVFTFTVSQAVARSSFLTVLTRLHESPEKREDVELTVGGGRAFQIFLRGFVPAL